MSADYPSLRRDHPLFRGLIRRRVDRGSHVLAQTKGNLLPKVTATPTEVVTNRGRPCDQPNAHTAMAASCGVPTGNEPFDVCVAAVMEILQSKCLFAAERALRTELEIEVQRGPELLLSRNLYSSRLEAALGAHVPHRAIEDPASEILDMTPLTEAIASSLDPNETELAAGACASAVAGMRRGAGGASHENAQRSRLHLFDQRPCSAEEAALPHGHTSLHGGPLGTWAPRAELL